MVKSKTKLGTLVIKQDPEPESPREWAGNLGTIATWHRRYGLGDVQPKCGAGEWLKKNSPKGSIELPIYMMDHSGIQISTTSKHFRAADPQHWDWGQLGVIVAAPEAIKKHFGVKRLTKKTLKKALTELELEVHIYNLFLTSQVWGFIYAKDTPDEDSCWGFIGSTLEESGLKDAVPKAARPLLEEAWNQRS